MQLNSSLKIILKGYLLFHQLRMGGQEEIMEVEMEARRELIHLMMIALSKRWKQVSIIHLRFRSKRLIHSTTIF